MGLEGRIGWFQDSTLDGIELSSYHGWKHGVHGHEDMKGMALRAIKRSNSMHSMHGMHQKEDKGQSPKAMGRGA